MTNSKYDAHTEPLLKELEMLKVKYIFDVQCMKFWYKFVNNILRHHFPYLLQEYPRAITQMASTHRTESFTLLKAYSIESCSYVCIDINCYFCGRNVM